MALGSIGPAIGKFLGLGKPAEKLIDAGRDAGSAIAGGVDMLWFTDEEKSLAAREGWELWLKHQAMVMSESSVRSITRRKLAVGMVQVYLFLVVSCAFVWKYDKEWALHIFQCACEITGLVMLVAGFYFGPYQVGKYLWKKSGKGKEK